MPTISWSIYVDGQSYSINLDHGIFSGKRIIQVNSATVHEDSKLFDVGTSEHIFQVNSHDCKITIRSVASGVTYNLYVDGNLQEARKFTAMQMLRSMPVWAWLFHLINGVVLTFSFTPIMSLSGGALVARFLLMAIIFLMVFMAIWIVSSHKIRPLLSRVVICLLLTIGFGVIATIAFVEACACYYTTWFASLSTL